MTEVENISPVLGFLILVMKGENIMAESAWVDALVVL